MRSRTRTGLGASAVSTWMSDARSRTASVISALIMRTSVLSDSETTASCSSPLLPPATSSAASSRSPLGRATPGVGSAGAPAGNAAAPTGSPGSVTP